MQENSVDSYINAQPEQAVDWNTFYNQYGHDKYGDAWTDMDPDHWFTKIGNFFTGDINTAKSKYQAYLDNLNIRNEHLASQSARSWDKMMDDTKYQRMMKDFEKAGLNPYLLVNNGSFSASAPSASKADYKVSKKQDNQRQTDHGRNLAIIILAIARIAAALL